MWAFHCPMYIEYYILRANWTLKFKYKVGTYYTDLMWEGQEQENVKKNIIIPSVLFNFTPSASLWLFKLILQDR